MIGLALMNLTRRVGEGDHAEAEWAKARTASDHAPSTGFAGPPPPFAPLQGRI